MLITQEPKKGSITK